MVEKKDRKTELYRVCVRYAPTQEEYCKKEILQGIINDFFISNIFTQKNRNAFSVKSKDLKYWISDCRNNGGITNVKLSYVVYNKRVKIINVVNYTSNKIKGKNEGDEEKQHLLFKHFDCNRSIIVFEKIVGAVSVKNLQKEINKYFHEKYDDFKDYEIAVSPVPSPDFLNELGKMDRISLLKVTIDREKTSLDEDVTFSEDNVAEKM